LNRFAEMLDERLEFINEAVEEIKLGNVHSLLSIPTKYALSGRGKRLRPLICTTCAEVVGGDWRETKNAFLALELIHNGTLVHDDIIDEDLFRRGNPSVHLRFRGKTAILTGDALLSLGLKYAASTGSVGIVERLSETALKMVQGVGLQTFYMRKVVSEAEYLDINYLKSGSLFESAAAIGGLVGSKRPEDHEALAQFGRSFGNAYQIRDDICGVYAENSDDDMSKNDLLNGDVSLLYIYALGAGSMSEEDREFISSIYRGDNEEIDIERVQEIYSYTGALERSIRRMKDFAESGRRTLEAFERSRGRDLLFHLLESYYLNFNPSTRLEVIV
jgi:geranylgeranyl pyrophosphate synthase